MERHSLTRTLAHFGTHTLTHCPTNRSLFNKEHLSVLEMRRLSYWSGIQIDHPPVVADS